MHILHKWTPWSEVFHKEMMAVSQKSGWSVPYTQRAQSRTCIKCNAHQERLVK